MCIYIHVNKKCIIPYIFLTTEKQEQCHMNWLHEYVIHCILLWKSEMLGPSPVLYRTTSSHFFFLKKDTNTKQLSRAQTDELASMVLPFRAGSFHILRHQRTHILQVIVLTMIMTDKRNLSIESKTSSRYQVCHMY